MNKLWSDKAWDDYLNWQSQDKKTLRKINDLIKDIERNGVSSGIGKPERLKYRSVWSRRIDFHNWVVELHMSRLLMWNQRISFR